MSDVSLRYLLFGEDRSASRSIKGVESTATRSGKAVGASFSKMGAMIGGEVGDMLTRAGEGITALSESAKGMGPKLAAGGAAATGLGVALSMMGSKDKEAQNALQAALVATGHSMEEFKGGIEETIKQQENYNHSAASTQQALATLTEATGSPKKAIESMGLVADLAAAKHIDLNSAAMMVAKGLNGNAKIFKQYGVVVQKNADGTSNMDLAVSQLAAKLHGQAAASVDSFSGRLSVLKTKIGDQVAEFGNKFGPALQVAGVGMMGFAAAMEIGTKVALGTRIQMGLLTAQTVVQSVAAKAAAAGQWLLNAAMEANPISLIVAALVGLVAIFVLLYKHSTTFRNAMNAAFHAVTAAAMWAFDWIKQHWPLILAILTGPVGIAVLLIVKNWDKIRSGFSTALDAIKGLWSTFMGFLRSIPTKVGNALSGMWSSIKDGFKAVLNGVIDLWNSMPSFHIPSVSIFGKHLGGGTVGLPHLQRLATGGVLTSSGAVVVGEHGREILDLPGGARVRPLAAMDTSGASGGGGDIHITINGAMDPNAVAMQIEQMLTRLRRNRGGGSLGFA